jgi:hypothetical protein
MVAMGMVQMAIHQVIEVVPMRYYFVAAVHAVNMVLLMPGAVMSWRALLGILRVHFNAMIIHMIAVWEMQVALVKVVGVVIMLHSDMAAVRAMRMAVSTGMLTVRFRHGSLLP